MRLLFIHQNIPGQFIHLVRALARDGRHQVVFITKRADRQMHNVISLPYAPRRAAGTSTHHYLRRLEDAVLHGQEVVRVMTALKAKGFSPDVVIGHPGWGELLFVKDVFPDAPLLSYCEYFYGPDDVDFERGVFTEAKLDHRLQRRLDNAHLLLSLEAADLGWAPTEWQKNHHPRRYQPNIEVVFDGVDTRVVKPDPAARFELPDGRGLTAEDEVVSFVARGLEPHRGFPQFIRALPELLSRRPKAQVVIAGEDKVFYGAAPGKDLSWRQKMLQEIALDEKRVHFVGRIEHGEYVKLLQVARVHVHLTLPYVLSWSFFEAMSAGCLVVASDTEPVREALRHGENGLSAPFGEPDMLAGAIAGAIEAPDAPDLRQAARRLIETRYSLDICLPQQLAMIDRLLGR